MARTKLVTGYVPIQGHPRSAKEYGELGENIFPQLDCVSGDFVIHPYYEYVETTWLYKLLQKSYQDFTHSVADNPAKNTIAYHCVQHQKFGWLLKAAIQDPTPETFVWIDYGIGHVPGVTAAVIDEFMRQVKSDDFAIPGCLERTGLLVHDLFPCWRFCGGVMVVPRKYVHKLYKAVKQQVRLHLQDTNNIEWEVNTLARIEPILPIRWYKADHNETMFTHYGDGL